MTLLSCSEYLTYQNIFTLEFLHRSSRPFFWRTLFLPRDLVPCPPVAPYADPSGDTTRLCLCKHSIDLLSQIKMKMKVYNPGGIGRARLAKQMDIALEHRKLYPASEKLQILSSVDSLMKKENMTQNQASVAMQVCPSQVSRWRACADDLAASVESGRDKLKLNQGPAPAGLLDDVEEDLVTFVDEWRMKGLPVSRLSLVRKACQLSPAFSEKSLPAQTMAISCIIRRRGIIISRR